MIRSLEKLCQFMEPLHDEAFAFLEWLSLRRKTKSSLAAIYNFDWRRGIRKMGQELAHKAFDAATFVAVFLVAMMLAAFGGVIYVVRRGPGIVRRWWIDYFYGIRLSYREVRRMQWLDLTLDVGGKDPPPMTRGELSELRDKLHRLCVPSHASASIPYRRTLDPLPSDTPE